jgi:hypothetical protein
MSKPFLFCLAVLLLFLQSAGQDLGEKPDLFPKGLTIQYGIGGYSIRDEYISRQKYAGELPSIAIEWARSHGKHVYNLGMSYRGAEIRNHNVSTQITQFSLNQGFLYPMKKTTLFRKDFQVWLGPATKFFFLVNDPDFAVSGFEYTESYACLFSLGLDIKAVCRLSRSFRMESSFNMSVISLGFRKVDSEENDESPVKLLTPFSGLNGSFDFGVRWLLSRRLSAKLAYQFELTRIRSWNPLLAAGDHLMAGLTYGF